MSQIPPDLHQDAQDVWTNVWHYVSDPDIRGRDVNYGLMQEAQMDRLLDVLRAGAPRSELLRYTFLG